MAAPVGAASGPPDARRADADAVLTDREWRDLERANMLRALDRTDGRVYGRGGAAELLGLNPTTLASRMRALNIAVAKAR
jgi:transcriptional regulator with GAF, ATPase, and Fis domain